MLTRILLLPANHLLARERWARDSLLPFAGKAFLLRWRNLSAAFAVNTDGMLSLGDDVAESVEIVLPDDAPRWLASDPGALMVRAQLRGPADFCEALAFVFRHLRWDAEADLAQFVGDIPARRLALGFQAGKRWQRDAMARLRSGMAAALSADENTPLLTGQRFCAHRQRLQSFCQELDAAEARLARLK